MNTISTFQTGLPFTPTMATSALNNGNWQLPNRTCEGSLPGDQQGPSRWFDTGCFVSPGAFIYGNSGTNILRGPGLITIDLAMMKNFPLPFREGMRIQFPAEAFNIANRANFRLPNFNIGVPASATINNTLTGFGRQIQMVVKVEF